MTLSDKNNINDQIDMEKERGEKILIVIKES